MWYKKRNYKLALRKYNLRVDLHVHAGEIQDFNSEAEMDNRIKSMLTAAIFKGLDIVGIISHTGPQMGIRAQTIIQNNHLDIYAIPGEEYLCNDKVSMVIFNLKQSMSPNLNSEQAITHAKKNGGLVMLVNLTKRQTQHFNKIKGQPNAPDIVEIFNAAIGGYQDLNIEYPAFISSAAKSPVDFDKMNIFTLISRQQLESMGLIPKEYGIDFTPKYLESTPLSPQIPITAPVSA